MAESNFVVRYSEFYKKFFSGIADSIDLLAAIQNDFEGDYVKIKDFARDPNSIQDIISRLGSEEQALLLLTLLKSGSIGRRMGQLFELDVEGQKTLASELRTFAEDITRQVELIRQKREGEKHDVSE